MPRSRTVAGSRSPSRPRSRQHPEENTMIRKMLALALGVTVAGSALAAVTADEAKQLGTTLTAIGAEKAANKDGFIPAYTGGITTPPASYRKGDAFRPDPFADEKPRLTITGKDAAAQGDKL